MSAQIVLHVHCTISRSALPFTFTKIKVYDVLHVCTDTLRYKCTGIFIHEHTIHPTNQSKDDKNTHINSDTAHEVSTQVICKCVFMFKSTYGSDCWF